jgi:hypothetical protein
MRPSGRKDVAMHQGHYVFAQLMQHLPLTTFRRCVARYDGERRVKRFSCLDQYLCLAFAQLTWRESLRDIEACLRAQSSKLYHLGFRSTIARNTLANANAVRDWRIYADFAQHLIGIARRLYADEPLAIELNDTVYALDSTTIDLCLSVFPWAPFRSTKAAVKMHTLLDLRGNIPSFIFISDGKMHDVNILDELLPEAGAFYIMDRGYLDFERLARLDDAGSFFVTRGKSNLKARRRYSHPIDRSSGLICDQTVVLTGFNVTLFKQPVSSFQQLLSGGIVDLIVRRFWLCRWRNGNPSRCLSRKQSSGSPQHYGDLKHRRRPFGPSDLQLTRRAWSQEPGIGAYPRRPGQDRANWHAGESENKRFVCGFFRLDLQG